MQIEVILKNFGLSEKEIAVYITLIELGPSSVREIAAKSKVNRGTTYDILKSLITLGIVSYYNKESKQYFAAEDPEKLLSAIDQKQENLLEVRKNIETSLPLIKILFEKQGGRPTVKLYEGKQGIRNILEDVLHTVSECKEKSYYVYSSANVRKDVYLAMPDFSDKRIKKNVKVKTIALGEGGQIVGLDERKWMPAESPKGHSGGFASRSGSEDPSGSRTTGGKGEALLKSTYEIIYCGNVAHISLDNAENPIGVVIHNDAIYETQKTIFEFNWKAL